MTLFVILSLLLAAAARLFRVGRAPAVAHVTDAATAAVAVSRPTRGLVLGLALLVVVVAGGGCARVGSPRPPPGTPRSRPTPPPGGAPPQRPSWPCCRNARRSIPTIPTAGCAPPGCR